MVNDTVELKRRRPVNLWYKISNICEKNYIYLFYSVIFWFYYLTETTKFLVLGTSNACVESHSKEAVIDALQSDDL